ncbi:hypothetical protein B0T19DRAFT_258283 [Cercophora scortea]|uniref:Uncharacterized protein n=1 Tax=Cercophora scortea TaxID=314031 RepID=A0AAE0I9S0_9PEZI|nr:hypothetical protein B0T19DRAFT_258283 [Cercophora scortea]
MPLCVVVVGSGGGSLQPATRTCNGAVPTDMVPQPKGQRALLHAAASHCRGSWRLQTDDTSDPSEAPFGKNRAELSSVSFRVSAQFALSGCTSGMRLPTLFRSENDLDLPGPIIRSGAFRQCVVWATWRRSGVRSGTVQGIRSGDVAVQFCGEPGCSGIDLMTIELGDFQL